MRNVKIIFFSILTQFLLIYQCFAEPFQIQENIQKSLKIGDITLEVIPLEKDSLFNAPTRGVFLNMNEIIKLKAITQNINETCYSWIEEERISCNNRILKLKEENDELLKIKDNSYFSLSNDFNIYKEKKEIEIEKLKKYSFIKNIVSSSIFFIVGISSTVVILSLVK